MGVVHRGSFRNRALLEKKRGGGVGPFRGRGVRSLPTASATTAAGAAGAAAAADFSLFCSFPI